MTSFKRWLGRLSVIALGAMVVLAAMPTDADARRGFGGFGSRGAKTFQAPPKTNTAPNAAAPINKSITQPGTPSAGANQAMRPGAAATQQASRFGGLKGLLMGGLFAAALAGIFGMGALATFAGFLLQMLLIGGIVYLLVRLFRGGFGGARPAMATASAQSTYSGRNPADILNRSGSAGGGAVDELKIGPADYDAFERLLGEVQMAYGKSDLDALEKRLTPEMLSYFAAELDENAKKGLLNVVSDVKLEQGDLAEAWREQHLEYATVALRYTLVDATIETATGRVVEGSRTEPTELTEIWTFARPVRGTASQWELSAVQSA
jgi:predicted lipid-binding transport protein (Tim44 family)